MRPVRLLCLGFVVLLNTLVAWAAEGSDAPDLRSKVNRYREVYTINPDGSFTETHEIVATVLKEKAIESMKQSSVSFSTAIQKAEVIEAYTQKRDGRKVYSPKSNYQVETNGGRDGGAPIFSDQTTMTVVFPDVEVGDELVFAYRLVASEPIYPGQFSASRSFPRTAEFDDVRVRFDFPAGLPVRYQAREMKEVVNEEKDGRHVVELSFANEHPVVSKRRDWSVIDYRDDPGYMVSTFKDHKEVALAYGARALPKTVPTDRIKALAEEIVGQAKTPREQARALYDWVATHITYAGNCIGLGAVIPHDLDFIVDNRMGDCKDHATLLQALLKARGIDSTQALVNAGRIYDLPDLPLVGMVNHVINYIPSLDLYVDSTSDQTPFGLLPSSDQDKPVLLVEGYREGQRTPPMPIGLNREVSTTTIEILPNGDIKGRVKITQKGYYALDTREAMRGMQKEMEDDLVKNMFKAMGYVGSGVFERADPKALEDTFEYGATLEAKSRYNYPGTGAFDIAPFFYAPHPVSSYVLGGLQGDDTVKRFACSNGESVEEYTIRLPKGMKIIALPGDLTLVGKYVRYEARYRQKGNVITARRVYSDRTPGNLCTQEVADDYRAVSQKALPNLKAQVLYR